MVKTSKNSIMLILSVLMVVGAILIGGCVGKKTQIIESVTPQEAFALIQENQDNPDFVIIDIRTPEQFAQEHIENAINLDYASENFRDELDKLDKNKTYLVYYTGLGGDIGGKTLDLMAELNFTTVYDISSGLDGWIAEGLPTIRTQIIEELTPRDAFNLIQENHDNPDFVIIDLQAPQYFAGGHIENAINLNYSSDNFRDELDKLDKNKTYLIYYTCHCGDVDTKSLYLMKELGFTEVYNISGGIEQWAGAGLPVIHEKPPQIIESTTPQEAFDLIQENQDNPDFVIIDIRNPEEFDQGHIENAINLDYSSDNFRDELDKLDKNKTYLIYYTCACGGIDKKTLDLMAELGFTEVYNISGGLDQWKVEELPTVQEPPPQIIESVTPQEAFDLIQENQDNPDFVIIDIRNPEEFDQWHVEDAINIDYRSEDFRNELDKLDKNKTYLVYYSCSCGNIDKKAQNMMAELGFKEVYRISGGLTQEKWEGLQP